MAGAIKNVLLIIADQWRGDFFSPATGATFLKLPNLTALSAEGVTFKNHFAQASPCAPSRASLYTGRYMMNHRVVQHGTPWSHHLGTLPQELRRANYRPAFVGYTSTFPDPRSRPPNDPGFFGPPHVLDGFDVLRTKDPEFENYRAYLSRRGYEFSDDTFGFWAPPDGATGVHTRTASPIKAAHTDTAWFVDAALDYLAGRRGRPWFLHLGTWRAHPPFIASEPFNSLYDPDEMPPPVRAGTVEEEARQHPLHAYYLSEVKRRDYFVNGEGLAAGMKEAEVRSVRATYCALLSEVDHHLGRVFAELKRSGAWDETLILFTSDHGEMLGDHYLLGKTGYFDRIYHVPLVVRDPRSGADVTRGMVREEFTEAVDLLPTILDWLGQPTPRWCDGKSLLPLARAAERPVGWRTSAHFEYDFRDVVSGRSQDALSIAMDECSLSAIRDEQYKYVHFGNLPPLLFDVAGDPDEQNNLAGDPGYRDVMLDYAQRMLSFRLNHADRQLTGFSASNKGLVSRE
jgi:arylsulfatase A-like enzyme